MMENISGDLIVKPKQQFALVVAEFNSFITSKLAEGAIDCPRHGWASCTAHQAGSMCPGAFEIPLVARALAKTGKYAAVICLGCVIRGRRIIMTMWRGR